MCPSRRTYNQPESSRVPRTEANPSQCLAASSRLEQPSGGNSRFVATESPWKVVGAGRFELPAQKKDGERPHTGRWRSFVGRCPEVISHQCLIASSRRGQPNAYRAACREGRDRPSAFTKGLKGLGTNCPNASLVRTVRQSFPRVQGKEVPNEEYCTSTRAGPGGLSLAVGLASTDANAGGRKICKQALMTHPMAGKHRDLMKQCSAEYKAHKKAGGAAIGQKRSPLAPLVLVRSDSAITP